MHKYSETDIKEMLGFLIDNIFVPFYTTKKEGSGIGLSLSRQILRRHSGNLEVISTEGEGATFIITL